MKFSETGLHGALIVEPERHEDERGFFSRTWSQGEFEARKLNSKIVECNLSFNQKKGTLRGMHFQNPPHEQAKLVRCTMGAIYDVIIDLRPTSATFKQWIGVELSNENRLMLYVPEGFAHGYQTLSDRSEVFYQMFSSYVPESSSGVRWNDPAFGITWPFEVARIINRRDQHYPDFTE
jgi:dTDP-4-dehydrorhamnose 3,5-epimerase